MTDEQRLQQMLSMFSYLLLQTSGDPEEALDWMRQLGQEYELFDEDMTLEDFINKLKELGYIDDAKDVVILTAKGVQRIREDALREVFTNLKKSPEGSHESPHTGQGVDRLSETKKYSFGDQPTNIDLTSTLTNVLKHESIDNFAWRKMTSKSMKRNIKRIVPL